MSLFELLIYQFQMNNCFFDCFLLINLPLSVHFRIRVMDQHKPRTLSPPTSGNTFWVIEAEKGIFFGK